VVELGAEAIWTLNVDLESQPGKRKRTANLKAGSCSSLDGYESQDVCAVGRTRDEVVGPMVR